MKKDWIECWGKLPQRKIQEWIERIPGHIQRIIKCEGGNEYREGLGREKNPQRVRLIRLNSFKNQCQASKLGAKNYACKVASDP